MNDIDNIGDQEDLTTPNADEAITTEAIVTEAQEPKAITLDEALAKAFEKHTPTDEAKPKTALPRSEAALAAADDGKVVDPITGRVAEPMKAPAGWTPALREKWGTVDPQIQKFIRDQEVHVSKKLQDVSDERKLASEFKEAAAPYEAMLRGFNTTATAHAKELFNLSHTLNTGSAQSKAQVIYNLINHFKPDPAALQALFAGQQPVTSQAPPPVSVEQEVQKVLSARDEAAQQQSITSDIERFAADPKNECFADVRDTMGRIITAGIVDAPSMPELFKKAYDLACSQHPEISQILSTRVQPAAQVAAPTAIRSIKPSLSNGNKSRSPIRSVSMDDAVAEGMRRAGLL